MSGGLGLPLGLSGGGGGGGGGGDSRKDVIDPPDVQSQTSQAPTQGIGGLVQRCVIIQKDERGYGFTVSGDNPVHVASVKQDGAAMRAGVQNGDRIVKVNGTLVTSRNHLDVVKLIKSGSYVALTLLGRPPASGAPPTANVFSGPQAPFSPPNKSSENSTSGHNTARVTAPKPVDPAKDREMLEQKLVMMRQMHETAREDFEKLQQQYVRGPSERLHERLLEKERTVKALETQLVALTQGTDAPPPTPSILPVLSPKGSSGLMQLPDNDRGLNIESLPSPGGGSVSDSPVNSPSVSPTPQYGDPMEVSNTSSEANIIGMDDDEFPAATEQPR